MDSLLGLLFVGFILSHILGPIFTPIFFKLLYERRHDD